MFVVSLKRTNWFKIALAFHSFNVAEADLNLANVAFLLGTSILPLPSPYRLAGLVVKASASGAEDPGFESRLRRDFSGSSHTSDSNIGTPVATLSGAWHYRVSTGTGRPGVSIL